jgi:hypothetical protein
MYLKNDVKDVTHSMFIVGFFTIAKKWKYLINGTHTHHGILMRHKKWNPLIDNTPEPGRHHGKWDKQGSERPVPQGHTHMENLKTLIS